MLCGVTKKKHNNLCPRNTTDRCPFQQLCILKLCLVCGRMAVEEHSNATTGRSKQVLLGTWEPVCGV